jgi:hypothetical protein
MSIGSCFPFLYLEGAMVYSSDGPKHFLRRLLSKNVVQSVMFLIFLRLVPGSNLGMDADYSD